MLQIALIPVNHSHHLIYVILNGHNLSTNAVVPLPDFFESDDCFEPISR